MNSPLFPHQLDGAKRIAQGLPTYLGLDMGIGKTRTFIEGVKLRKAKRVLIVCPASAVLVWKREIALWHKGALFVVVKRPEDFNAAAFDTTYFIVSHGLMSQTNGAVAEALVEGSKFDLTAIDEAHAFNAADTNRVKALRRAAFNLGNIIPLSGTPMRNHAGELYTLLSVCWPAGLKASSGHVMQRTEFEDHFCKVSHRSFGGGRMVRVIDGSRNLDQLKRMISPFMLRVRKDEVFKDLPPILWDQVPVPLDPQHFTKADAEALEQLFASVGTSEENLTAALSAASSSVPLMATRRMLGIAKLRGATEYIVDMLDNLPENRKVLVFAHHAHVINALHRHLGEYLPAVLTGRSTPREREEAVDTFLTNSQCRVFIGNIQAAGTAITLVGPQCKCSDVVFVESSWTPMDNAQAACRVHRIGQQDGVVARMLSAAGTVDDVINGLLVRKAKEFTQLFDSQNEGETK